MAREPIPQWPRVQAVVEPDNRTDKQRVLDWLASIGETDQDVITETMGRCRVDKMVRGYFLSRSRG